MADERTLSEHWDASPIEALRVEVTDGVDHGRSELALGDTFGIGSADGNDLVLTDPTVSRFHLELSRCPEGIRIVDHDSRNGTVIGTARIKEAIVPPGTALKLGRTSIKVADAGKVPVEIHAEEVLGGVRGRTPAMRRMMARVQRAAQSDTSVLIVGESGTGKELIARALHDLGLRAKGPFVTVDCGTLSPTLVASELFGHERGAFTGAEKQHIGAFERANGGTVFLDEIGELPATLQANLLGVLERRRLRRVGGTEDVGVDVRVVSATNRDLRSDVNEGSFRLDLYYRIAVVTLRVPPLRERPDDVPLLVEHFLREAGCDEPLEDLLSPKAMKSLSAHRWPGNVRELRNVVEATLTMGEAPELFDVGAPTSKETGDLIDKLLTHPYKDARAALLQEFETRYLSRLLDNNDRNIAKAARQARIDRTYLLSLLKKHDLK